MENTDTKTYYSIAEVAQMLNVTFSYLHFLERAPIKLEVKKNSKKTRFYTEENISVIKQIIYLTKTQGHTLKIAAKKISGGNHYLNEKTKMLEELKSTKEFLVKLREEISK